MKRRFRAESDAGQILAIDPKAISSPVEVPEQTDNATDTAVCVVTILGPLEHHSAWCWDSYDDIEARCRDAFECDDAGAVVLRIDSPGGDASGCFELHKSLQAMRKQYAKPLFAYVGELAASAAYSIASACDEIWLPASGCVGSVGVIGTLMDRTAANKKAGLRVELIVTGSHKGDGHPDKPITDDVMREMQGRVDSLGELFFDLVADARGMSPKDVRGLQARVLMGAEAVSAKLADGVASWDEFLRLVGDAIESSPVQNAKEGKTMLKINQLIAAVNAAATPGALASALASLEKEIVRCGDDGDDALQKAIKKAKKVVKVAKAKKSLEDAKKALKKAKADEAEDEDADEDAEDEDADDADDSEDAEDDAEESDDSEDEEDSEEDEDEEDSTDGGDDKDDKDAKALLQGKTGLYTYARLYRLAKQVTGRKSLAEVFGALAAIQGKIKDADKTAKRVARLETESKRAKVDEMLKVARREGRIVKSEMPDLRSKGMQDPKWLRGYLAVKPAIVHTEDGFLSPENQQGGPSANLTADQRRMAEQFAAQQGRPVADVIAEIQKTSAGKGAAPKF